MAEIVGIKLDKADRIILAELDRNCRTPLGALAKKARKSRQSMEYRIKRLVEDGIITSFHVSINPHKMGYKVYKLYFQLRNIAEEKKRFYDYLRKSGRVYWMGECDGVWDVIMGMFAKSDYEFYALKNELLSEFRSLVVKSYGDVMVDTKQYPKMYFTGELAEPTEFAGLMVENQLDALDHSILGEMVNNARLPLTAIASKVGSTPATVSARLKRMEKLGIIIQYRISVDMDKLGVEMYKAIIHLERYTKKDEKELLSFFSSIPNTQYLIRNMWNVEPEVIVSNYHEYHALMDRVKQRFPHVIRNVESVLFRSDEWTPGYKNLLGLTRKEKKETG